MRRCSGVRRRSTRAVLGLGWAGLGYLTRLAPVAVSAVLLILVARSFAGQDLLARMDLACLGVALALSAASNTFLSAWRWWLALRLAGAPLGYRATWRLWTGLLPLTFLAPLSSGHALYAVALRTRWQALTGRAVPWLRAIEAVAYDKLLALLGVVVVVLGGQLVLPAGHPAARVEIVLACLAGVAIYAFDRPLGRLVARLPGLRGRTRVLVAPIPLATKALMLGVATAGHAAELVTVWLAARGLGLEVPAAELLGVFPLVTLLAYLPISYSGFGVREASAAWLLTAAVGYDGGVSIALVVDLVEYVWPAFVGLAFVRAAWGALAGWRRGAAASTRLVVE